MGYIFEAELKDLVQLTIKTKSVAVILLFVFVVQTYASPEIDDFLMESADDSDRHPYVQCKIDLYDCINIGAVSKTECTKTYYKCMKQLIPTIPPWMIQCKDELSTCLSTTSTLLTKGRCFVRFGKCLKNGGPTSPPTFRDDEEPGVVPSRHPYVQCKIDLYDCIRLKKKAKCFKDYGYCLINKGPSPPPSLNAGEYILNALEDQGPAPTRHPYLQCKVDLYKCIKDGQKGKLQCMKDYKNCMAQLIPTLPPYVAQCSEKAKVCYKAASGWKAHWECGKTFFKCLKNKGSS